MFHSMTKSVFTGLVFSSLVFVAPSHAHTKKEVQKMHITEICATSPSNLPCANLVSHAYFLNEIFDLAQNPAKRKETLKELINASDFGDFNQMWQLCKEMSVFKDTSKVIAKLAAIWFGQELDWSNDRVKIEAQLLQNHFDTLFVE